MKIHETDDLGQVAALHMVCFPHDQWEEGIQHWIVTHRKVPVGFASITATEEDGTAMLLRTGITTKFQGRGTQRALIRVREEWAAENGFSILTTYVHKNNFPSLMNLIKSNYRMVEVDGGEVTPFIYFEKVL